MFSFLAKSLDRWTIRLAAARFNPPDDVPNRAAEAEQLLRHPDFFCDFAQKPPDLKFTSPHEFQFATPLPSPWEQNNTVHGRFYPSGPDWQKRPSILLLHGWNGEYIYKYVFSWLSRRLARIGLNAASILMPYHGRRRAKAAPPALRHFMSADLCHNLEATRQAIAEIRSLLAWLAAQGAPTTGLWGISMGAWLGGLVASHDPRARFNVFMSPMMDLNRAIEDLAFCEPIRRGMQGLQFNFDHLNLVRYKPIALPAQNLIVESLYEQFVSVETVEEVWRAWDYPEIWRVPHGHISVFMSPFIITRVLKWIKKTAINASCGVAGG